MRSTTLLKIRMLTPSMHHVFARVTVLLTAICACAPSDRPTLGIALSGSTVDAARMAIRDAAAEGSLPQIDTVIEYESSGEASVAIGIARDFVERPGLVAVVGHSNSASSLAAAQVYNDAQVVQLAPTSTAVLYARAGPYSFRMVPADDQQGEFLAETVRRRYPQGAGIALFYINDDYGRGLRASLLDALDQATYPLLLDIPHVEGDLRLEVIKQGTSAARDARPDVVLWLSRSLALSAYLPALRAELGAIPIIAGDAVSTWPQHLYEDDRWAGVQHVEFVDLDGSERLREFGQRFQAEFGLTASGADVLTYDSVRMLLAGIQGGATTGAQLRTYLRTLGSGQPAYDGLSGPIAFTDGGDVVRRHLLVTIPSRRRAP